MHSFYISNGKLGLKIIVVFLILVSVLNVCHNMVRVLKGDTESQKWLDFLLLSTEIERIFSEKKVSVQETLLVGGVGQLLKSMNSLCL